MTRELDELVRRCVTWLHDEALQVGPGKAIWCEDGFRWRPGPVEQRVRAASLAPELEAVLLQVQTRILESAEPPGAAALDDAQQWGTLSALSYADGATQSTFELLVYPELASWQLVLAGWVAAVQLDEAAHLLAALPLGRADFQPAEDVPTRFDSIIEVGRLLEQRSYERADEIVTESVLELAAAEVGGELVALSSPGVFRVSRPWRVLPPAALDTALATLPVVSYVGLTGHPRFGPGFGIRSMFPVPSGGARAERVLNALNGGEPCPLAPRVGAWLAPGEDLLVQTFLPAGLMPLADAADLLGNVLSYHERMMRPVLEVLIEQHENQDDQPLPDDTAEAGSRVMQ